MDLMTYILGIKKGIDMETRHAITDSRFFGAGKALFTVSNADNHRTFKIRKKIVNKETNASIYFAMCRQEHSYVYLGIYNPGSHGVFLTKKSVFTEGSVEVKALRFAIARVSKGLSMPEGYAVQHEGKCCRCGRKLTEPTSINRGVGPECWTKF